MYYHKRSRSTKKVFQIVPNNQETSPSPVQLQRSDTIETKNEDLNNDALEQQSVFSLSNNSTSANPDKIVPNNQETSPSPVQLQRSDTIETKNEDPNNDALEQQSVFSLSNNSTSANPDNISLELVCDASDKPHDDEDSPKERLKSSLSNLSTLLLRPQSATSSVPITDDTNVTSPSLTTMTSYKSDFNSDTSNGTTRSSSATTASSTDGEVCIVLNSAYTLQFNNRMYHS